MHHLKRLFKASAAGKDNLCLCIGDAEFGPPDTPHQGTFSALQASYASNNIECVQHWLNDCTHNMIASTDCAGHPEGRAAADS